MVGCLTACLVRAALPQLAPSSVLWLAQSCLGLGGEEGTTVMPTLQMFKSQSCVYSAFDTPGREDLVCERFESFLTQMTDLPQEFVSNFLSITSLADAAVMVVSATWRQTTWIQDASSINCAFCIGRKRRVGDGRGKRKGQRAGSGLFHNGHQDAWLRECLP